MGLGLGLASTNLRSGGGVHLELGGRLVDEVDRLGEVAGRWREIKAIAWGRSRGARGEMQRGCRVDAARVQGLGVGAGSGWAGSVALSGRKRSVMYRSERAAAATRAESAIETPWCTSYRS